LTETYLGDVNPIVQEQFVESLGYDDRETSPPASTVHERFRIYAAAFTAGERARTVRATQPARKANTDIYPR